MNYISGGKKEQRDLLECAFGWYMKNNMPRYRKFDIVIKLSTLEDCGYCLNFYGRKFLIEIDKNQTTLELLRTFFHEMTHFYQYCRGDLKDTEKGIVWKRQHFNGDSEYQPWENEAYDMEDELTQKFYDFLYEI